MKHKIYKKVVLVILDGFGVAPESRGNAICQAKIPTLNYIISNFPSLSLQASGPLVGLPWGEMGNSEVGHLNMGAGRVVGQDLPRITTSIQNREFFKNPVFLEAIEHATKNKAALHLLGMISPGGVHSLDEHLYALLGMAVEHGLDKVYIHMFTDGRDTEPTIALESIKKLNAKIATIGVGRVASVAGRFYAMDRAGHWAQTMRVYDALVGGKGKTAGSAEEAIKNSYNSQIFDEMIEPTVILGPGGQPEAKISENDSVIFFNFRSDRALQLSKAFVQGESLPPEFKREPIKNLYFATMSEYSPAFPAHAAFPRTDLKNNLAEVLSLHQMSQYHIAESEKFAHITSFFNCGRTEPYGGEERVIINSPVDNASNYVDRPQMSAPEIAAALSQKISESQTNFFVANFANCDMVGHTGSLRAGVASVEAVDLALKKILDACVGADAVLAITGDHGNIEQMINLKTGDIDKDHTTNPVPFLLVANEFKFPKAFIRSFDFLASRVPGGIICDVAPTILALLGVLKPEEMTGIDLLEEIDEVPRKKN